MSLPVSESALPAAGATLRADRVSRLRLLLAWIGEVLNAVLVKEVRAALRSRYFRVIFLISLFLSTLVGTLILAFVPEEGREVLGFAFFSGTFACAALGAVGLVPFWAFMSMNAEADENALDFLLLTNLLPRHVVLGKLLAAGVQSLLILSAYAPFAMFAFLLKGVDLTFLASSFVSAAVLSVVLSSLGVAFSCAVRVRWARVLLMVLFGFLLFYFVQMAFVLVGMAFFTGAVSTGGASLWNAGSLTIGTLLAIGALCFAFACSRLAHAEESGSTALRLLSSTIVLLGTAISAGTVLTGGGRTSAQWVLIGTLFLIAIPTIVCCTEREALPLGARVRAPLGWRAWLVAPFLSGGGRGALLFLVQLLFVISVFAIVTLVEERRLGDDPVQLFVIGAYAVTYVLLPSGVLAPFSRFTFVRRIGWLAIFLFALATWLVPSVLRFALAGASEAAFKLPGNPLYVLESIRRSDGMPMRMGVFLTVVGFAALAVLVNVPRMAAGWWDVQKASRERAARDASALRRREGRGEHAPAAT